MSGTVNYVILVQTHEEVGCYCKIMGIVHWKTWYIARKTFLFIYVHGQYILAVASMQSHSPQYMSVGMPLTLMWYVSSEEVGHAQLSSSHQYHPAIHSVPMWGEKCLPPSLVEILRKTLVPSKKRFDHWFIIEYHL